MNDFSFSNFSSQKEDEIEDYLRKRYAGESMSVRHFGDGGEDMSDEITQQPLLPDVKQVFLLHFLMKRTRIVIIISTLVSRDPNLWLVRCQRGREKDTVLDLMGKFLKPRKDGLPLQIKSAVIPEGLTGYVYIEAIKKVHVQEAIIGIRALDLGKHKQEVNIVLFFSNEPEMCFYNMLSS